MLWAPYICFAAVIVGITGLVAVGRPGSKMRRRLAELTAVLLSLLALLYYLVGDARTTATLPFLGLAAAIVLTRIFPDQATADPTPADPPAE